LLDSGALYFALGALVCLVLGAGAVRRLFQGANKTETPADSGSNRRQRHRE
jgi:hypothetical protein